MWIKCFNYKNFFRQSPSPSQGKVRKKRFIGSWKKKDPYQGSWRKVFEQTYSQQTDNKEQTGKLENLFCIQNRKISFIGFVIVPVMCIFTIFKQRRQRVGLQKALCWKEWRSVRGKVYLLKQNKVHNRGRIEQCSENKSWYSIWVDIRNVFEPYPNPKISLLDWGSKKSNPKIRSKSKVIIEGSIEN